MDLNYVLTVLGQALLDHIMVPIVVAFGGAILFIIKPRIDRVSKSVVAKNEIEEMQRRTNIHKELVILIDNEVKSAVLANMQLADKIKEQNGYISDEDATTLNTNVRDLVFGALPATITADDGALLQILGGREKLDAIISSHIEQHLVEYKLNRKAAESPTVHFDGSDFSSVSEEDPPVEEYHEEPQPEDSPVEEYPEETYDNPTETSDEPYVEPSEESYEETPAEEGEFEEAEGDPSVSAEVNMLHVALDASKKKRERRTNRG